MPPPLVASKTQAIPRSFGLQNPVHRPLKSLTATSDPMERWLSEDCLHAPYHTIGYVAVVSDAGSNPPADGKPVSGSRATAGSRPRHATDSEAPATMRGPEDSKELRTFNLDSRIFRTATEDHLQMKAEELMICCHEVYGYDFALKRWGIFSVANIRDVEFNSEAFDHLLLSSNKKQLISSLVMQHGNRPEAFDDYIRGKGKGLIFLLHESIADYVRRPLFTVTARDMGHNLKVVLGLATQWNAVVLVDEADVFMQQRDLASFYRDDLVSSLLRVLEYFEGIMFLTTNRVETIDSAFQSRIHLSITYPALSHAVRQELWRNWITRENSGSEPDWLTQVLLDNLANRNLNGREIKNAMQIAHALSRSEKRRMHATDVFRALEADEEFRTSFQKDLDRRKAEESQATNWQQEEHGSFLILRAAYRYFRDIARLLALGET
ncbi:hypothetical protein NUW58_g1106 [Xylaria curta]|uniref:Uncharacterized protein n=1 Tax=Xylaria curta TaxID=42375 RepID=A0ACC1PNJ2_9PEZI|nr:hypothetical protein NUW58_g1106 [Xylaria curta]